MRLIKNKINIKTINLVWIVFILISRQIVVSQTITATRTNGDIVTFTCDGTDDHIEINQALEYVKENGGTVTLSAGTFIFDGVIWIAGNNTTLQGAGMNKTTLKLVDNAGWSYYFKNKNNEWELHHAGPMIMNKVEAMHHITLRDLKIDGNKYEQYHVDPATGDTIRDIRGGSHIFDGQGHYIAIDLSAREGSSDKPSDILFSHVFIYENAGDGFAVTSGSNIKVEYCMGIRGGHSQIYFFDPKNLIVENCDFMVTANSGIRWYDGNHIIIRNNHIYGEVAKTGNSNWCIQMTSGQASTISDDILIENNRLEFTAGAAIALDAKTHKQAKDVIIRNNVIFQTGNTVTYENRRETGGINIKNFTNTLIENNTIVNCIGGGIRLGGFVGFNDWPYETGLTAIIKNNIITNTVKGTGASAGAEGYGIDIAIGDSAVCSYNNVWGNESGGYHGCEIGKGDISFDPKFKSIVLGTDFFNTNDTTADLHLKSKAGSWNNFTSSWETDNETSFCINGGDPTSDYSKELAPNGNRINMGAFGNTEEASKGSKAPPIANAGIDQFIRDEDGDGIVFVDLDGSGSKDNGTIVSYSWKRNGVEIATGVTPHHVAFVLGKEKVILTVTDDDNISVTDDVIIKVIKSGENIMPTADAGHDLTVTIDGDSDDSKSVTLDGSGSLDKDGTIVSYTWKENSTQIGTGISPTIDSPIGVHYVELTVTDNEGGVGIDTVKVTVKGKANYSLEFNNDSDDEYVLIEGLPHLSTLTLEMWIKQSSSTDDTDGLLYFGGDGQRITLKGTVHQVAWGEGLQNMATGGINLNTWHHIAMVVNNDSLTEIFVDGVLQEIYNPSEISLPGSSFSLASYYGYGSYAGNFKGKIDELRYWSVARTEAQIKEKMNTELVGTEEGLIGYWNFNDGSGTNLSDLTSNNYRGTLNNMEEDDWTFDVPFNMETGGVKDLKNEIIANKFLLFQNYPNPFNPSTVIRFELPTAQHVILTVYNMLGEKVAQLINRDIKSGYHEVTFDASEFSSGVYIYRIIAGNFISQKKMLLLQ